MLILTLALARQIHDAAARFYVREDNGRNVCSFAVVAAHCLKAENSHCRVAEYACKAAAQALLRQAYDEVRAAQLWFVPIEGAS